MKNNANQFILKIMFLLGFTSELKKYQDVFFQIVLIYKRLVISIYDSR